MEPILARFALSLCLSVYTFINTCGWLRFCACGERGLLVAMSTHEHTREFADKLQPIGTQLSETAMHLMRRVANSSASAPVSSKDVISLIYLIEIAHPLLALDERPTDQVLTIVDLLGACVGLEEPWDEYDLDEKFLMQLAAAIESK